MAAWLVRRSRIHDVNSLRILGGAFDPVVMVPRLTLAGLLLVPIGSWYLRPCILLLATAGLLFPVLLSRPQLWLGLSLLTGWRAIDDWPLADNHAYLLSYWCLAIAISVFVKHTRRSLALNGRLLLGLVFGLATLHKVVISPDYMDGTFFRHTLIVDARFEALTRVVGGLSPEQRAANEAFLLTNRHSEQRTAELVLINPPAFRVLVQFCTWSTVVMEALVAACFLWPTHTWVSGLRHAVLLFFCVSTYAVATVAGFGWLLVAMGLAQCGPGRAKTRWAYVFTYALILVYEEVPWAEMLVDYLHPDHRSIMQ